MPSRLVAFVGIMLLLSGCGGGFTNLSRSYNERSMWATTKAVWRWTGDEVRVVTVADIFAFREWSGTLGLLYVRDIDDGAEDGDYGIVVPAGWEKQPRRERDSGILELVTPIDMGIEEGYVPYSFIHHQLTALDRERAAARIPDGPEAGKDAADMDILDPHYGVEIWEEEGQTFMIAVYGQDRELCRWVRLGQLEIGKGARWWPAGRIVVASLATPFTFYADVFYKALPLPQ